MSPRWSLSCLLLLGHVPAVAAQDAPAGRAACENPELIFACKGDAVLSQADLDAAFSRIPESDRLMFIRDGAQVDKLVASMMQYELIALDAEREGFAQEPVIERRVRLAARAELASAWMEELTQRAPEADYAAMAYEDYLANPAKYSSSPTIDVSHILISAESRTSGEAEELAGELYARLQDDPEQFNALVMEYSDDPGKIKNGGRYEKVSRGQMAKPFEDVAFSLQSVGEISEPVETGFGYHIIRLDARQEAVLTPFEDVKGQIMEAMKQKYLADYRLGYLKRLMMEPTVFPNGAVEVMVRRYFGDDLEKAPIFTEEGVQ